MATGHEVRHRPVLWLKLKHVDELPSEVAKHSDSYVCPLEVARDRYGGIYAVKELVYTYAMWVSPRFHGAVAKARSEGLSGTAAAEAAEREFTWLRDWCHDRWHYIGVEVTLLDAEGNPTDFTDSCWQVEDNGDSADVIANDLALGLGAQVNWDDVIEIPARTVVLKALKVAA